MTGSEFVKRVKKHGKAKKVDVVWDKKRGKGSHGTLYYGSKFTVVRYLPDELKTGTLNGMLGQLGLTVRDIGG